MIVSLEMKLLYLFIFMSLGLIWIPGTVKALEQGEFIPSLTMTPEFTLEIEAPPLSTKLDECRPIPGYWFLVAQIVIAILVDKNRPRLKHVWRYLLVNSFFWIYLIFLYNGCANFGKSSLWILLSLLLSGGMAGWAYWQKW